MPSPPHSAQVRFLPDHPALVLRAALDARDDHVALAVVSHHLAYQ